MRRSVLFVSLAVLLALAAAPGPAAEAAPSGTTSLPGWVKGRDAERLPTKRKVVALTFDAGSSCGATAKILDVLKRKKVPKADFTLTGQWAERCPRLAKRIAARYSLGNHTFSHADLTRLSDASVRREVNRAEATIKRVTGVDPRPYFRFPYGARDARTIRLLNRLGYGCVRWTTDTWGWMGRPKQTRQGVVDKVLRELKPGGVVMMHVGWDARGENLDSKALPTVIDELRRRGYSFVSVHDFLPSG